LGHHRGHESSVRALRVLSLTYVYVLKGITSSTHTTRVASRLVTCHLLREVNSVVVFDLIMITTTKSSRLLLHFSACNHSSECYSILSIATSFNSGLSLVSSHCYLHLGVYPPNLVRWCCTCLHFCCFRCLAPPDRLLELFAPPCLLPSPALLVCPPID
jgi:hypothetical protein